MDRMVRFFMIGLLPVFWLALYPAAARAQIVTVSEEVNMLRDANYDLLGRFGEHLLLSLDKGDEVEIQAFDNNLFTSWVRTVSLEVRKPTIHHVYPGKDHFYIFYSHVRRDSTFFMVREFDGRAQLVDSLLIRAYPKGGFYPRLKFTASENKQFLAVHFLNQDQQFEVFFLSLEKLGLMADHVYDVRLFDFQSNFKEILLSNKPELFIVLDNISTIGKRDQQLVTVIKTSPGIQQPMLQEVRPQINLLLNSKYAIDNRNQVLIGGGLYGDKSKPEPAGCFRFTVPLHFSGSPNVAFVSFDAESLSDRSGRKNQTGTIGNLYMQDMLVRRDGGIVLVSEVRKEFERSLYQGRRDFYSMRFAVDYYYEDLVVVAIDPDGTPHWQKLLQKKQYSFDDDALYSSYFLFRNPSSVRLLYNDEIKNENTVSEYILTGGGLHERRSLLNTNRQDLRLQVSNSLQISENELIIPSVRRNRLKLVKISYDRGI